MSQGKKTVVSMTGFGGGEVAVPGGRVRVEVKSVNHRYLDVSVKSPREYISLDTRIVEAVRGRLRRGKVDVFVSRSVDVSEPSAVKANLELARGYRAAFESISRDLRVGGELTLAMIVAQRDVVVAGFSEADPEAEWPSVEKALGIALEKNAGMRSDEGRRLATDLLAQAGELRRLATAADERAPKVVVEHRARLQERLKKLLADTALEPARLDQEIALLADRTDVHEELVRLRSHLDQLDQILAEGGEIGRKLDFLLQEIGRETNTLGSKANDVDLGKIVVELKTVAERVREQIQNIE
jgi:uncharacterized protein (TIGR00255 family)